MKKAVSGRLRAWRFAPSEVTRRKLRGLIPGGVVVILALILVASVWLAGRAEDAVPLPAFERIDAHAHVFTPAPEFFAMLRRLNLRIVNVCVVDKHDRGFEQAAPQHAMALRVFQGSQGGAVWCSTFDPEDWESPGFATRAILELDQTFEQGAVAVKIYKSIGMELKSKAGKYLMPDDPNFDAIFDHIAARNKTLYAHIAEPPAAWLPLDPASPDYDYYKNNPAWYMYGHHDHPTKGAILAARDRMLKRHPALRVVGCHLGSMEENVDEIARRFDLYPNFAVDTAARVPHLMLQSRAKVRAFLIKYQDRVLYGTDHELMPWSKPAESIRSWEEELERDWKYFATDQTITYAGHKVQGLALPPPVLRRLYHDNAVKWVKLP